MNDENLLSPNQQPINVTQPAPAKQKHRTAHKAPQETGRNPYDGLRPWSAITHGIGAVFALLGTILLLLRASASSFFPWSIPIFGVYGISMIGLYTASTLYHCLNTGVTARIALRKYDHISIYGLIAGTYTPICLIALFGTWGWSLFGIIWVLAVAGVIMSLLWINAPRWITAGIYLFMGWLVVVAIYPVSLVIPAEGLFWLIGGGILYTIGGVLYALKWPGRGNPRFGCHEVFHVFIILGSIFHFMLMYRVIVFL